MASDIVPGNTGDFEKKTKAPYSNSLLSSALGVTSHKPTLTQLLSSTDLASLTRSKGRISEEGDDSSALNAIELPTLPPLSHELFAGPDFTPSEFLLSRRHMGLDDLRGELRSYLATLRESLVAVINTEYEAFIGLSLGLRHASVSTSLTTIRRPVMSIRSEVTRVKSELEGMRDGMSGVLEQRKQVREKKAILRRLLEMEDSVEKVESLLKLGFSKGTEKFDSGRESDLRLDPPAKRLERIVGEYSHMLYLVGKAGDFPFVRSLDPRVARITSTLHLDLSRLLSSVLEECIFRRTPDIDIIPSRDALLTLFRTYASISMVSTAEGVIRSTIMQPRLSSLIHKEALTNISSKIFTTNSNPGNTDIDSDNPRPSIVVEQTPRVVPNFYVIEPLQFDNSLWASSSGGLAEYDLRPLATLYNSILAFVSDECSFFLDITERTLATSSSQSIAGMGTGKQTPTGSPRLEDNPTKSTADEGYRVLANVVWDEIGSRLMNELGHVIFSAGRPTIFQKNYLLTMAFINKIEDLSPTVSHLNALRSNPTFTAFIKRFQLPVYFQLRFKEIISSLERALSVGSASGGGDVFVMSESEAVWKSLKTCWHDEVYLSELSARFWKLSLQLLSRYRLWLDSVVPKYVLPPSASSTIVSGLSANTSVPPSRTSFEGPRERTVSSSTSTRPSTPSGGIAGSDADTVSEEATLRQLTVLIADSTLMAKKAMELYEMTICTKLAHDYTESGDGDDAYSPSMVLIHSLKQLTSIVPNLSSQIITILTKRCSEHLKSVRSVASQVRASTRKGPSEPSYFVANILKELRAYLTGPGRVVEEDLRIRWATAVVEDVASRYAAILSTQKKTEDSLRWFKKGRQQLSLFGRGGGSSATDESNTPEDDKVKMQMQLDVDTLGRDAEDLGVNVAESMSFTLLRNAIAEPASTSTTAEKK